MSLPFGYPAQYRSKRLYDLSGVLTFAAPSFACRDNRRILLIVVAAGLIINPSTADNRLGGWRQRASGRAAPLRNVNDGLLIDRIAIGDERALAECYDRFAGIVNGLARRALGAAAAEEVVQETFLRVWSRASTYAPEKGSLNAWVLRIARHLIIDELRRRKSRPSTRLIWESIEDVEERTALKPDEQVWQKELREAVRAACDELSRDQRAVVALAYFGGLTQSEVARELGIPLGTVKTRTRAALFKLRDLMADRDLWS